MKVMTEATRDLLKRALALSPEERAELVRELRATLEPAAPSDEVDIDPDFTAELERRIRDLDEGNVKPIPFSDLIDEARSRLDARRKSRPS